MGLFDFLLLLAAVALPLVLAVTSITGFADLDISCWVASS
jgi:hypothetical protein